ncbi:hypothetical protein TRFO_04760 [Tritrichomonas foetus]|uniref:BTB domain-containing protein n=1 Tax=Tritrichomonas foetus TaxID=1144522 RepID=A0A1J4KCI8_9EUKA|nr:hypothetical protein TRFO_04760 [Tritrichomonas foetus]|eukprot:OHT08690.1 hypothetical protein TRFO_04760 [Tritrichomonas foetus]
MAYSYDTFEIPRTYLQNTINIGLPTDFEFRFANKTYSCSKFHAAFISPYVSRLLNTDPTIDWLQLPFSDDNDYFSLFMNLMKGEKIQITADNISFLINVSQFLKIENITSLIKRESKESVRNCIQRFILNKASGKDLFHDYYTIAFHIKEIPSEDLKNLTIDDLKHIFSHQQLALMSENEKFEYIKKIANDDYPMLLGFIDLERLSEENLSQLLEDLTFDKIDHPIFCQIKKAMMNLKKGDTFTNKPAEKKEEKGLFGEFVENNERIPLNQLRNQNEQQNLHQQSNQQQNNHHQNNQQLNNHQQNNHQQNLHHQNNQQQNNQQHFIGNPMNQNANQHANQNANPIQLNNTNNQQFLEPHHNQQNNVNPQQVNENMNNNQRNQMPNLDSFQNLFNFQFN